MKTIQSNLIVFLSSILILAPIIITTSTIVKAENASITLDGQRYEFDKKSNYNIDASSPIATTDKSTTLGTLSIIGDITDNNTKNVIPSLEIADGTYISISYSYSNKLKNADSSDWHLAEDSKKSVNGIDLDNKIQYGAVILQTSLDQNKWVTCESVTNLSTDISFNKDCGINDIQLINGCYYRIIVAYETEKDNESAGFFDAKVEQKWNAEVYEFYASYKKDEDISGKEHNYSGIDYTLKAGSEEFSDFEEIKQDDPHFAINLGTFCLSGYTDTGDKDNIYLKTVGNKIKLTYKLKEDIFCINGQDNLSIARIKNGSDRTFQRRPHDMGHGELIIKYTNEKGESTYTEYSNYLEALTSPNADTTIQLFEEGDYEVALDYAIKNSKAVLNNTTYYRTSFDFKIRNGNCMVYVFDAKTGAELGNGDIAKNGFRIDSAKSSYPKITIKKEVLNSTANGLIEDPRFNRSASDGEIITEEGIYTITAHNRYDSKLEPAVKTIYIGNDNILTAYMTHLNSPNSYSIEQLVQLKSEGYVITDDGEIIEPTTESTVLTENFSFDSEDEIFSTESVTNEPQKIETTNNLQNENNTNKFPVLPIVGAISIGVLIGVGVAAITKRKKKR